MIPYRKLRGEFRDLTAKAPACWYVDVAMGLIHSFMARIYTDIISKLKAEMTLNKYRF